MAGKRSFAADAELYRHCGKAVVGYANLGEESECHALIQLRCGTSFQLMGRAQTLKGIAEPKKFLVTCP